MLKSLRYFIIALAVLGLTTGCDFFIQPKDEQREGNVTIQLGSGSGARALSSGVINTLRYEAELRGPGGQALNRRVEAGTGIVRLSLSLGEWEVSARAYTPGDILAGTGSVRVTIVPGGTTVMIPMTEAVTKTPASISSKEITEFSIVSPVTAFGSINEGAKTIDITVPLGTDLTSMTTSISHTGASISPASGTAEDFSGPVTYTVTARDTSTAAYTVGVTRTAVSTAKAITAFSIISPAATGSINEAAKTIEITVPAGTVVTALITSISVSQYATVSPVSGTAVNFSTPQIFTVTAEDGSSVNYTAVVLPVYTLITVPGGTVTVNIGVTGGPFITAGTTNVLVEAFKMGKTEITYELWYAVRQWAAANGYIFANAGREGNDGTVGAAPTAAKTEPVTFISWRDSVVWCNAYSEIMGKTPYYYLAGTVDFTDSTKVIRESENNFTVAGSGKAENAVRYDSDGFRLPTEAQWEYAARGGVPSAGTSWTYTYAGSNTIGDVAWYNINSGGASHPVGTRTGGSYSGANSIGLYDMSGNVFEWCWDIHSSTFRIFRGGSWDRAFSTCSVAYRGRDEPYLTFYYVGFRIMAP